MSPRLLLVVRVLGAVAAGVLLLLMVRAVWAWPEESTLRIPLTLLVAAGPLVALVHAVKPLGRPWARRVVMAGSVAVFVTWLAWDDAELAIPLEDFRARIASATAEQRANHALLMRYSAKVDGQPPEETFVQPKADDRWGSLFSAYLEAARREPEVVAGLVAETRETYAWIVALDAVETWVDLSEPKPTTPIPSFAPIRDTTRIAAAHAVLLAERGEIDAAVEHLLPLLSMSGKLERSSRLLVGRMIAIVVQKMAMEALGEILDAGQPGAETKARLIAVLQASSRGEAGVRELMMLEYHGMGWWLSHFPEGPSLEPRSGAQSFGHAARRVLMAPLFNRRHTVNVMGEHLSLAAGLAAKRQPTGGMSSRLGALRWSGKPWDFLVKNSIGTSILTMAVPAFDKLGTSYWEREDKVASLIARLEAGR